MTQQEIKRIENAIRHIQTATDVDPWAAEIAVEAMEKQIPQKPIRIDKNDKFDGNWKKVCPLCGRMLIERITTSEKSFPRHYNYTDHCWCGQAIDCMTNQEAIKWLREAEKALEQLPSAQPERKRGRWIVHYECPKCGEITKDFMEYCPFCNADMRGEEDE